MPATSPPGPVPARPGGPFDTVVGVLQAPPRRLEADAVDFPDETCHLQRAGRGSCGVLLGRCLRRTEVVGEGRQISRLRCGQVGERRGGLAWGGGVPEGGPGENGDGDVEGVVAKRPPVALVGVEGGRVARPVGQHVA